MLGSSSTGQGRKTDDTDAHSVALVGTRMTGWRPVVADDQLAVLRMLVDRRMSLGEEHTRKVCQLHALLLELPPGGAKKEPRAEDADADSELDEVERFCAEHRLGKHLE